MKIYQGPLRRYEPVKTIVATLTGRTIIRICFFVRAGEGSAGRFVYVCKYALRICNRSWGLHQTIWWGAVEVPPSKVSLRWTDCLMSVSTNIYAVHHRIWDIPFPTYNKTIQNQSTLSKTTWWKIATWWSPSPHPSSPEMVHLSAEVSSFKFEATAATQISTRPCQRVRSKSQFFSKQKPFE